MVESTLKVLEESMKEYDKEIKKLSQWLADECSKQLMDQINKEYLKKVRENFQTNVSTSFDEVSNIDNEKEQINLAGENTERS